MLHLVEIKLVFDISQTGNASMLFVLKMASRLGNRPLIRVISIPKE